MDDAWNSARKWNAGMGFLSCAVGGLLLFSGIGTVPGGAMLAAGALAVGRALTPPGTTTTDKPKKPKKSKKSE